MLTGLLNESAVGGTDVLINSCEVYRPGTIATARHKTFTCHFGADSNRSFEPNRSGGCVDVRDLRDRLSCKVSRAGRRRLDRGEARLYKTFA